MPERVLIQPAPLEYGLYREQYDALIKDLEAEGVLVRVVPVGDAYDLPTSDFAAAETYDLVIQVGQVAGAIVGTPELIEIVRRRLRRLESQGAKPRRAKIYLANGEEDEFIVDGEDG